MVNADINYQAYWNKDTTEEEHWNYLDAELKDLKKKKKKYAMSCGWIAVIKLTELHIIGSTGGKRLVTT